MPLVIQRQGLRFDLCEACQQMLSEVQALYLGPQEAPLVPEEVSGG